MAKIVDSYKRYVCLLQGSGIPAGVMLGDALLTAVVAVRIGEYQIIRAFPLYVRSQSLGDDVEHWHLTTFVVLGPLLDYDLAADLGGGPAHFNPHGVKVYVLDQQPRGFGPSKPLKRQD